MKLWHLKPNPNAPKNLWSPWYDKAHAFVIRADYEHQARALAAEEAGDEQREGHGNPWTSPEFTICEELPAIGPAGVIVSDFRLG